MKRDLWKGLKMRLERIALGITGRQFRIYDIESENELGYTASGQEIHLAPSHPIMDGLDEKHQVAFVEGVFAHELMHQLATDFANYEIAITKLPRLERRIFQMIFNIMEDPAIEYLGPCYIGGHLLNSLVFSIMYMYKTSPEIDGTQYPFSQLIQALIQYGDGGLLKGDFTSDEAKDMFYKVIPIFDKAITEPDGKKRIHYAKQVFEETRPLWQEEVDNQAAFEEMMKQLEQAMESAGKGTKGSGDGPMNDVEKDDSAAGSASQKKNKRRKFTFHKISKEEAEKMGLDKNTPSNGQLPDGDVDVYIVEGDDKKDENGSGGNSAPMPNPSTNQQEGNDEKDGSGKGISDENTDKKPDGKRSGQSSDKDGKTQSKDKASGQGNSDQGDNSKDNSQKGSESGSSKSSSSSVNNTGDKGQDKDGQGSASPNAAKQDTAGQNAEGQSAEGQDAEGKQRTMRGAEDGTDKNSDNGTDGNDGSNADGSTDGQGSDANGSSSDMDGDSADSENTSDSKTDSSDSDDANNGANGVKEDSFVPYNQSDTISSQKNRSDKGVTLDMRGKGDGKFRDVEDSGVISAEEYELSDADIAEIKATIESCIKAIKEERKAVDDNNKVPLDLPEMQDVYKDVSCLNVRVKARNPESLMDTYNTLRETMQDGIGNLTNQLKRIFKNEADEREYRNSGRVNVKRLSSGRMTTRVFDRRKAPSNRSDICVMLLIDESGSMSGNKERCAKSAAIGLAEVFGNLNIPISVIGFTADVQEASVVHFHYLHWLNTVSERVKLLNISSYATNFDGYSIRYATKLLLKRPETHKILIVLSDGTPSSRYYRHGPNGVKDTSNAIKEATKKVDVIGVAVGNKDTEVLYAMYKNDFLHVGKIDDLYNQLAQKIKNKIKGW